MSDLAVRAVNLSKKYRIGGPQVRYRTIRETLVNTAAAPVRRAADIVRGRAPSANGHDEIWALKDVSFDIKRGEVVGIIGPNGAGKSTLLKILSRITRPTEGYADIYGRVGSLLEVGTGFHPELTGRENVYLSGAVLGMQRAEIERKFDEIVDFAGVEKFIDTPVKHFSSGMYLRLAFSVAAHLEPEILLVDEVLAVGDAAFQKKCLGKMGEVAEAGRTVLFVSHNMVAVRNLCQRVVRLESGKIIDDGAADEVVHAYLEAIGDDAGQGEQIWADMNTAPGTDAVRVKRIYACFNHGRDQKPYTDHEIELGVEFWSLLPDSALVVTLLIVSSDGSIAFTTSTAHSPDLVENELQPGLYRSWCQIPPNLLNSNLYRIHVLFVRNQTQVIFKLEDALTFEVLDAGGWRQAYHGRRPGVVAPLLPWQMERVAEHSQST